MARGYARGEWRGDMKLVMAIALLACASTGAAAVEPEGQGYGVGMHSCAEFADAYKAQPAVAEPVYFLWAEGFLSGMNFMATANHLPARRLASINMESAKVEIRTYCDAHPLAPYYEVVLTIYERLPALPPNSN